MDESPRSMSPRGARAASTMSPPPGEEASTWMEMENPRFDSSRKVKTPARKAPPKRGKKRNDVYSQAYFLSKFEPPEDPDDELKNLLSKHDKRKTYKGKNKKKEMNSPASNKSNNIKNSPSHNSGAFIQDTLLDVGQRKNLEMAELQQVRRMDHMAEERERINKSLFYQLFFCLKPSWMKEEDRNYRAKEFGSLAQHVPAARTTGAAVAAYDTLKKAEADEEASQQLSSQENKSSNAPTSKLDAFVSGADSGSAPEIEVRKKVQQFEAEKVQEVPRKKPATGVNVRSFVASVNMGEDFGAAKKLLSKEEVAVVSTPVPIKNAPHAKPGEVSKNVFDFLASLDDDPSSNSSTGNGPTPASQAALETFLTPEETKTVISKPAVKDQEEEQSFVPQKIAHQKPRENSKNVFEFLSSVGVEIEPPPKKPESDEQSQPVPEVVEEITPSVLVRKKKELPEVVVQDKAPKNVSNNKPRQLSKNLLGFIAEVNGEEPPESIEEPTPVPITKHETIREEPVPEIEPSVLIPKKKITTIRQPAEEVPEIEPSVLLPKKKTTLKSESKPEAPTKVSKNISKKVSKNVFEFLADVEQEEAPDTDKVVAVEDVDVEVESMEERESAQVSKPKTLVPAKISVPEKKKESVKSAPVLTLSKKKTAKRSTTSNQGSKNMGNKLANFLQTGSLPKSSSRQVRETVKSTIPKLKKSEPETETSFGVYAQAKQKLKTGNTLLASKSLLPKKESTPAESPKPETKQAQTKSLKPAPKAIKTAKKSWITAPRPVDTLKSVPKKEEPAKQTLESSPKAVQTPPPKTENGDPKNKSKLMAFLSTQPMSSARLERLTS